VLRLYVTQVDPERLDLVGRGPEHAVGEQSGVQADDLVSGLTQYRHQYAADVAVVTGYEYAHGKAPEMVGGWKASLWGCRITPG
jgi:hypothetical protein